MFVYADNAATTAVSKTAMDAMLQGWGNPSSVYALGTRAAAQVKGWRADVAGALGCLPEELFFTSCGSESDNWAIQGALELNRRKGGHIITTAIEHAAVLEPLKALERQGYEVTLLQPNSKGNIDPEQIAAALRPDTALVSIMLVNNELGTILPVREAAAAIRRTGCPALLHCDAVQGFLKVPFTPKELGVDLLSVSGHKLHAPKGVGALYIRKGIPFPTVFMDGGGQERGRRAGTENVAGIVGLGEALTEALEELPEKTSRVTAMRDRLISELTKLPKSRLNGHPDRRLPGNCNISFQGVEGEALLLLLDNHDICASSGSACTSGSLDPSHVLLAIGLPHEIAHGSLRLSLGDMNTPDEVEEILKAVPQVVERLRAMSPVWEKIKDE